MVLWGTHLWHTPHLCNDEEGRGGHEHTAMEDVGQVHDGLVEGKKHGVEVEVGDTEGSTDHLDKEVGSQQVDNQGA
jgi:hypothetical protein